MIRSDVSFRTNQFLKALSAIFIALPLFGFGNLIANAQALSPVSIPTAQVEEPNSGSIEFSVVAIKPAHRANSWLSKFTEDEYIGEGVPVYFLIRMAFSPSVASPDISGLPKWAQDTYDIRAKVAAEDIPVYKALTREQQGVMLQKLLADRFQFRFHYGTTIHSVYELTTHTPNPKLEKLESRNYSGAGDFASHRRDDGALRFQTLPDHLARLAKFLSWSEDARGRMVVDHTHLPGFYNIDISWCPFEETPNTESPGCNGLSLAMVLKEQLGLQMKPAKATLPTVTIDHIERPSPN